MAYNREKAVIYAHKWAYLRNPDYYDFSFIGGDCTNFISQILYAGFSVMDYREYGWYYRSVNDRSYSWTGVNELYKYLTDNNDKQTPKARICGISEAETGDIVQIRFKNSDRFSHTLFIVDNGGNTPDTILIAAHSDDCDYRKLSGYPYAELRFLHIF